MQFRDYYATLGVGRTASEPEIKKAYRRLARQHHPDLNPGNKASEAKFKEINEAYEVLGHEESRKKYDELGANWKQYEQAGAAGGGAPYGAGPFGAGGARRTTRTMTPEEMQELFGGQDPFSDFFHTFFDGQTDSGTRDRNGRRNRRSQSRTTRSNTGRWAADSGIDEAGESGRQIDLTLAEVLEGAERRLVIQGEDGTSRTVTVKIPKGVAEGARIRVAGSPSGGDDLYLRVHVLPHPTIERRGQDLHQRVLVPVTAAVLGGEVAIPALSGSTLRLKVPAGTQGGRVFRLKGHGLPTVANSQRGDLYVTIDLQIPQVLTDEARLHYEALRDLDEGRTT